MPTLPEKRLQLIELVIVVSIIISFDRTQSFALSRYYNLSNRSRNSHYKLHLYWLEKLIQNIAKSDSIFHKRTSVFSIQLVFKIVTKSYIFLLFIDTLK